MSLRILDKSLQSQRDGFVVWHPENLLPCKWYGAKSVPTTADSINPQETHCTTERVMAKINLWGARAEGADPNACKLARFIDVMQNNILSPQEVAAAFNIGVTGTSPTAFDKSSEPWKHVYEASGLMVREKFFQSQTAMSDIIKDAKSVLEHCLPEPNYSKVILTYYPGNPYQAALGGTIISTEEESIAKLGQNSFHPERFKWEAENKFMECSKWDGSAQPVHHEGWHNSSPCIEWAEKILMVFDIAPAHVEL